MQSKDVTFRNSLKTRMLGAQIPPGQSVRRGLRYLNCQFLSPVG
jgi:hypothetical protein